MHSGQFVREDMSFALIEATEQSPSVFTQALNGFFREILHNFRDVVKAKIQKITNEHVHNVSWTAVNLFYLYITIHRIQ